MKQSTIISKILLFRMCLPQNGWWTESLCDCYEQKISLLLIFIWYLLVFHFIAHCDLAMLVYKIFILHRVCSFEKAIFLGDFWHTLRKMFWSDIYAQIWSSISWTQQKLKIGPSVQNIVQCENLPIFLNISIFLRLRRSDATTLI